MVNCTQKKKQVVGVILNTSFNKPIQDIGKVCAKIIDPEEAIVEKVSSVMETWNFSVSQERIELVTSLPNYNSFSVTVQEPKQYMHF